MVWKAIIIDDEPNNIENLTSLLNEYCRDIQVIGQAENADEGKSVISRLKPDMVFLDIQMPDQSGFDLLKSLDVIDFEVIFVTAYDKYGIQAVKFSAVDYLLKPVNIEELKTAAGNAIQKLTSRQENENIRNLLHYLKTTHVPDEHKIALSDAKEVRFIGVRDILYCKSDNVYTTFFIRGQDKIMVSRPMKEYEDLLVSYGFIRTHQSYLVNKSFIRSYSKEDGGYLLLEDRSQIPVSRQKKEDVKKALNF